MIFYIALGVVALAVAILFVLTIWWMIKGGSND